MNASNIPQNDPTNLDSHPLRVGSSGSLVRAWQGFLRIALDGHFGPITELATKAWQATHGLEPNGIVTFATWQAAGCVAPTSFVEPCQPRRVRIDTLVIGATANPQPHYNSVWPRPPSTCIHYWIAPDAFIEHLGPADPEFRSKGIHARVIAFDLATHNRKNLDDWDDPDSQALLRLSARIAADHCRTLRIPRRFCDEVDLRKGRSGITTRATIARAFNRPEPNPDLGFFPMNDFIDMVKARHGSFRAQQERTRRTGNLLEAFWPEAA